MKDDLKTRGYLITQANAVIQQVQPLLFKTAAQQAAEAAADAMHTMNLNHGLKKLEYAKLMARVAHAHVHN